jgi:cholestenol Delta-isomerase
MSPKHKKLSRKRGRTRLHASRGGSTVVFARRARAGVRTPQDTENFFVAFSGPQKANEIFSHQKMDVVIPRIVGAAFMGVLGTIIALLCRREKAVMWWYLFVLWIHALLEVNYAVAPQRITTFATTGFWEYAFEQVKVADLFTWEFWVDNYRQYAKYDVRYTQNQGAILPIMVQLGSKWRHPLQIINAMMQAYGTVIYFAVPYLSGKWTTVFHTTDPIELWLGVYLLNGLWIIVPTLLIIQSSLAIARAMSAQSSTQKAAIAQKKKN